MGLASEMRDHDAVIFEAIGEVLRIGTTDVPGIFFNEHRDVSFAEGGVMGLEISFDCTISDAVSALEENEEVEIVEHGTFIFLRRIPDAGDESGLVTLELGSIK
jgi:hypothetical protein